MQQTNPTHTNLQREKKSYCPCYCHCKGKCGDQCKHTSAPCYHCETTKRSKCCNAPVSYPSMEQVCDKCHHSCDVVSTLTNPPTETVSEKIYNILADFALVVDDCHKRGVEPDCEKEIAKLIRLVKEYSLHPLQLKILEMSRDMPISQMTLREIGKHCGTNQPERVKHHIKALIKIGLLDSERNPL